MTSPVTEGSPVSTPENRAAVHPARVTYLVKSLQSAVRRDLDAQLQHIGLTTPQYAALSVLERHPGLSSAKLARRSFVTAQSMQVMVAGFERSGYIDRHADPDHQRILQNYLTDEGKRVLVECDAAADAIEERMLASMTEAQVQVFRETVEKCLDNVLGDRRR